MNSSLKRDVVKEYVEAFRKQGLKTMLYYSILDTHHELRPGFITKAHIDMVKEQLPALSCLPINKSWFWKEEFPTLPVKDPTVIVKENLEPFNLSYCNFILNVAPNRDGLIDPNAVEGLKKIGAIWKEIYSGNKSDKVKVHRFDRLWGNKVKIEIDSTNGQVSIAEFGVYDEQR